MASLRKRGPYPWQAQVRKKGQPAQSRTFETRAAAERWARAIEVEMDNGAFVSRAEAESTTLKELLERYLVEVTAHKKGAGPETNRLRLFMRHSLAQRVVAGVRSVDIARWRDERRGRGVSLASDTSRQPPTESSHPPAARPMGACRSWPAGVAP